MLTNDVFGVACGACGHRVVLDFMRLNLKGSIVVRVPCMRCKRRNIVLIGDAQAAVVQVDRLPKQLQNRSNRITLRS